MTPRRDARRATGAALVVMILAAACGGPTGSVDPGRSVDLGASSASASAAASLSAEPSLGSAEPSDSAEPTASAGASATPVTSAPPTTRPPASTPTPTPGAGSLSPATCALVSAAQMESAMNVGGIAARPEPGDARAGYCTYLVGDRGVAATSLLAKGAAQVIATYGADGEPVGGVGDEAIWVRGNRSLFVRKGDRLFGIQIPAAGPVSADDAKSVAIELGRIAAARL